MPGFKRSNPGCSTPENNCGCGGSQGCFSNGSFQNKNTKCTCINFNTGRKKPTSDTLFLSDSVTKIVTKLQYNKDGCIIDGVPIRSIPFGSSCWVGSGNYRFDKCPFAPDSPAGTSEVDFAFVWPDFVPGVGGGGNGPYCSLTMSWYWPGDPHDQQHLATAYLPAGYPGNPFSPPTPAFYTLNPFALHIGPMPLPAIMYRRAGCVDPGRQCQCNGTIIISE